MAKNPKPQRKAAQPTGGENPGASKLDQLTSLLTRSGGATLDEMMTLTGWQAHSVRGAMAGALKKRGHVITSVKEEGVRRYRIGSAQ